MFFLKGRYSDEYVKSLVKIIITTLSESLPKRRTILNKPKRMVARHILALI